MRWALVLSALAAIGLAKPISTAPEVERPDFSDPLSQKLGDVVPGELWSMIPDEELFKPDFDFGKWYLNFSKQDNGGNMGWTSLVEFNPQTHVWPRGLDFFHRNTVTIPYCFDNQGVKDKVDGTLKAAIAIWMYALGGPASRDTHHGLRFFELSHFCKKPDGAWNSPIVPLYALRVMAPPIPGSSWARAGFFVPMPGKQPRGGENELRIGAWDTNPNRYAQIIAHELGHVIGMAHEHSRSDRDHTVRFKCEKLAQYQEAKDLCDQWGEDDCKKLCTDIEVAKKHDFDIVIQYMIGDEDGRYMSNGPHYDVYSIMHYSSYLNALPDCRRHRKLDECALVRYTSPGDPNSGVAMIETQFLPTTHDVEFVRRYYSWQD